jgi:hypothetical protein
VIAVKWFREFRNFSCYWPTFLLEFIMTTDEYTDDKKDQSAAAGKVDSGSALVLYMENGQYHFHEPNFLSASLRHFTVITEFGALTAQYGRTLFPRPEPYIMDVPGPPYNIDFRTDDGVYFIRPESGKMIVYSKDAGLPDTYIHTIFFIGIKFKDHGREITVDGVGEATFVFN